jgi:hypothetical protein
VTASGSAPNKPFTFHAVLDESSQQEDLFHMSGVTRLVDLALDG